MKERIARERLKSDKTGCSGSKYSKISDTTWQNICASMRVSLERSLCLARGVDIFGELYYWEDQRQAVALLAQVAGYIHSVNRYESMCWDEECTYRANERDFRSREAYRKQLQAEQIAREIAMEEAEEEMERLQEVRRQEMAERRRQDESMDKFERFFNNLSGQGSWTNEELARMGKKTSDEMRTDKQLREMYRNMF